MIILLDDCLYFDDFCLFPFGEPIAQLVIMIYTVKPKVKQQNQLFIREF